MANEHPKHIIAVSAYVTNEREEALLVKTHWRADTWELPGGQVEEGESLDVAVRREVFEETGLIIKTIGITGVYYNRTSEILAVVFKAAYISGELTMQQEEIRDAKFTTLDETTIDKYITRPHMKSRALDAINAKSFLPYETWETSPYKLVDSVGK